MNDHNKNSIRITEHNTSNQSKDKVKSDDGLGMVQIRKPLIFFLMALVCVGCLYLIFRPGDKKPGEEIGFNASVPQAADDQLQSDKQKAYEQQLLEKKDEEKKNGLTTLSDYWKDDNVGNDQVETIENSADASQNKAVESYKAAQQTLGSFYNRDDREVNHLKNEVSRLRNELLEKEIPNRPSGINEQLELMERSYQMAAKYLPSGSQSNLQETHRQQSEEQEEIKLTGAGPAKSNVVSRIYRETTDSAWIAGLGQKRFMDVDHQNQEVLSNSNSVQAVISETMLVRPDDLVSMRLSQPMRVGKLMVPKGTLVKATAKFLGGRLQLQISSIEYRGMIQPVEINAYDNDGQSGLYVPYTSEQGALTDIVAGMGQSSGTNLMLTSSAGQQAAADLSRGVVQGLSGYFQKKVRSPKVTVKSGHQVYLISKK